MNATLRQEFWNLPNFLTLLRIFMIPVVMFFIWGGGPEDCVIAAWIYSGATLTDFFDGYLARKQGLVTVMGKFLDPLADKLIVMASLVWMVPMGRIPAWIVVVLLAREISVTGLRSVAASEGVVISAGQEGKTKTALQMIGIIALLVGYPYHLHYFGFDMGVVDLVHVGQLLVYLSMIFSMASFAQYLGLFAMAVEAKESKLRGDSTHDLSG